MATVETKQTRPRLAASSYLNTAPLIWSFQQGNQRDTVNLLTDAAPAHCADLLAEEKVEAALVPIIEYQRLTGARVIRDVCVGSKHKVRSVILVSKHDDLKLVRRVALDSMSRTSEALVKIIFREFLNSEPRYETASPDIQAMLANNDAALLIGDPAMNVSSENFHVFDLAALWRRFTQTGFVFAMWMTRDGSKDAIRNIDFPGARDEGLNQIETIIDQYETEIALPREELRQYLTDNITYEVDAELQRGVQLYFELAAKHGLIAENKPLEFVSNR